MFAHGVAARRIALAGDRAAGGLTVALLNLLKERREVPMPSHMLLVWPVAPAVANEWVKPPPAPQERSDVQRFGFVVSAHHSAR
jgi:acetyl esterase/lipase